MKTSSASAIAASSSVALGCAREIAASGCAPRPRASLHCLEVGAAGDQRHVGPATRESGARRRRRSRRRRRPRCALLPPAVVRGRAEVLPPIGLGRSCISDSAALYLAGRRSRNRVEDVNRSRHLERSESFPAMWPTSSSSVTSAAKERRRRPTISPYLSSATPNDDRLAQRPGCVTQRLLDLEWRDVLATAQDHLLQPADQAEVPALRRSFLWSPVRNQPSKNDASFAARILEVAGRDTRVHGYRPHPPHPPSRNPPLASAMAISVPVAICRPTRRFRSAGGSGLEDIW